MDRKPELKTEEGYSADIYPWRYMVRTMSALYPSSVFSSGVEVQIVIHPSRKILHTYQRPNIIT